MKKTTTIGIDLAKNIFAIHGTDEKGHRTIRKELRRDKMAEFFANLPPCLIGMEACGSAHYWARKLEQMGHNVRILPSQFVRPYVKSNKNDAADAEAICEAVTRPNMRFVSVKSADQQAILSIHRARQGFVKARTAQANQIRGLLAEYGIVIPQGIHHVPVCIPEILEDGENELPGLFRELLATLLEQFNDLSQRIAEMERHIKQWHKASEASRRIGEVPGIGPLTATALIASIGDANTFENGRQVSAWLGLVPRQYSSGGKQNLQGISKRGDSYLRSLLIHGARAVVSTTKVKSETESWVGRILARKNVNVATVAVANRNARIVWALLKHDRQFKHDWHSKAA